VRKEECGKKRVNFYVKINEIKNAYLFYIPMVLLVYKETHFNTNELDPCIHSVYVSLLQDYNDILPDEAHSRHMPSGLSS
jgi:hypothetical protein